MKFQFTILFFLLGFQNLLSQIIPWPPKEKYYSQKIDHFNFISFEKDESQIFKQRFLYEDKWFKPGCPIFFYCGNKGDVAQTWNHTGFIFELAVKFNAFVIFGEHRYYGKSLPFGSIKSFQQPYIQFLSVEQALSDYVYLITDTKSMFKIMNSPVIVFGGSYGGCLAAYMRFKYPNVVLGALASSAPISWVSGSGNFHEFFEIITKDFYDENPKCVKLVKVAFNKIETYAAQGLSGYKIISEKLRLCTDLTSNAGVIYAMKWLRNAFVMLAMEDFPYVTLSLPPNPVREACKKLLSNANDPIIGLREASALFYGTLNCYKPDKLYVECSDITGCGLGPDAKSWDFQSCTEMNLYDGSNSTDNDMFPSLPLTLKDVTRHCKKTWEVKRAPDQLKLLQWGKDVQTATNVIFSNGDLDPWSKGGIMSNETLSKSSVALIVKGGAHCSDLRTPNQLDPLGFKEVRKIEENLIRRWINSTIIIN